MTEAKRQSHLPLWVSTGETARQRPMPQGHNSTPQDRPAPERLAKRVPVTR
jgi:hypothetical protein